MIQMNRYTKTQIHQTTAKKFKWYETLESMQFLV